MSELKITLAGDRTAYRPGEPLSGRAAWRVDGENSWGSAPIGMITSTSA